MGVIAFVLFFFGEDDPKIYPGHLDKMLGLELALRVKYQPYYHQFSVLGFSLDPAVIRRIRSHLHPREVQPQEQQANGVSYAYLSCYSIYN